MGTSTEEDFALRETVPINGFELFYETRGGGEPLLLLHGGAGAGENWRLIFDQPPSGFRLVVPDLRGHGSSTNPSGEFTFRQSALDVLALADHLGIERFKAVGASLGAKTLLHVATLQPGRVEAMVLVSATPSFPEQARQIMAQVTADNRSEDEWRQMRQWHKHGDEQIRDLWRMMNRFKDTHEDLNFTPSDLAAIMAQTLVVHGDRDALYPVDVAMELFAAIPDSYLWVVPNGDHIPIFAIADSFRETSLAFLRGEWSAP